MRTQALPGRVGWIFGSFSERDEALALLDDEGIVGELVLREVRSGRVEVVQMWGRPESVRQEFARRRAQ